MNVLLITSDQQRWDCLGMLNPKISTPNLDRLCREGILFRNAYTPSPVCTPARCSMLTGLYPSKHGAFQVGTALPEDFSPNIPRHLSDVGHFTALLGKAHFQPCYKAPESFESEPNVHNLDFFRTWKGPYYGFQRAELVIGHNCESHAGGMNYGAWLREQGVDIARYFGNLPYTHFGRWDLPEEFHGSKWVADITIRTLDDAQQSGKPFFLWSSFQDPHNPFVCPEPWLSMYSPDDMPIPNDKIGAEDLASKPDFYRAVLEKSHSYGDDPDLQFRAWSDCRNDKGRSKDDLREIYRAYYGMISLMDHHIGRILRHLEEKKLLDDTVVIFTSDHGDYLGHHGLWGKGLPAYDDTQKVPFIVRHPHCSTPGAQSKSFQSLLDIPASILDIAGLGQNDRTDGVVQTESWKSAESASRSSVMVELHPSQSNFMQWTYLENGYKLVKYRNRSYGELYDMDNDLMQRNNLFGRREFADIAGSMSRNLEKTRTPDGEEIVRERTAMA